MREIKFRAWEKTTKRMFVPTRHLYVNGKFTATDPESSFCSELVMQFTGLYDKDSKEIYEGDTVYFLDQDRVVEWTNDYGYKLTRSSEADYALDVNSAALLTVIGNIYETPTEATL